MAELFVELFREEIPSKLQIDARNKIKGLFEQEFLKKEIKFASSKSFSTPKRLVFIIDGIPKKIEQKKKIIKGPKIDAPQVALEGFIRTNNLVKFSKRLIRAALCKFAGISSLKISKKNSDIILFDCSTKPRQHLWLYLLSFQCILLFGQHLLLP